MLDIKKVKREDIESLYPALQRMSRAARLKDVPTLYCFNSETPQAYYLPYGPLFYSSGIRKLLKDEELLGVFEHELAHANTRELAAIRNYGLPVSLFASDYLDKKRGKTEEQISRRFWLKAGGVAATAYLTNPLFENYADTKRLDPEIDHKPGLVSALKKISEWYGKNTNLFTETTLKELADRVQRIKETKDR